MIPMHCSQLWSSTLESEEQNDSDVELGWKNVDSPLQQIPFSTTPGLS
jgi:hypothetical protein